MLATSRPADRPAASSPTPRVSRVESFEDALGDLIDSKQIKAAVSLCLDADQTLTRAGLLRLLRYLLGKVEEAGVPNLHKKEIVSLIARGLATEILGDSRDQPLRERCERAGIFGIGLHALPTEESPPNK